MNAPPKKSGALGGLKVMDVGLLPLSIKLISETSQMARHALGER